MAVRRFSCSRCRHEVHFEDDRCRGCSVELGYFAERRVLRPLKSVDGIEFDVHGDVDRATDEGDQRQPCTIAGGRLITRSHRA